MKQATRRAVKQLRTELRSLIKGRKVEVLIADVAITYNINWRSAFHVDVDVVRAKPHTTVDFAEVRELKPKVCNVGLRQLNREIARANRQIQKLVKKSDKLAFKMDRNKQDFWDELLESI